MNSNIDSLLTLFINGDAILIIIHYGVLIHVA